MSIAQGAALAAIIGGLGAGLVILSRISARMGQLIERLDGHIRESDASDADHENRLRDLEKGPSRRRR